MKDYTNIQIPFKFSTFKEAYPNFYKPIGIVAQNDYSEAIKEENVHWMVLYPSTDAAVFKNNKNNKIVFFCDGFDQLMLQLQKEGFNARKHATVKKPTAPGPRKKVSPLDKYYSADSEKRKNIEALMEMYDCDLSIQKLTKKDVEEFQRFEPQPDRKKTAFQSAQDYNKTNKIKP